MKNIIEILQTLLRYYNINRQKGHTTAIFEGAKHTYNAIVLTSSECMSRHLKALHPNGSERILSIHNLDALWGVNSPLLVDNSAMVVILAGALTKIDDLISENEYLRKKLNR